MTTVARSRPTTRVASHSRAALLSFGLLVLTAGLLVMSFALPIFRVSRVQIVGRNLPAREIASVAGVSGRNIFTIRGSEVAVNVARIPNILVTGVDVSLPNVVVIRATLRRGLFAWREAKSLYLVDAYGRLISRVETTSLPVVYNQTGSSIGLGGYVIPAVAEAVPYIRHALPRAGIRSFIFNPRRGLVLHSTQGWAAVLGHPVGRALVTRIATLRAFLTAIAHRGQHLKWVDLRSRSPYASFS